MPTSNCWGFDLNQIQISLYKITMDDYFNTNEEQNAGQEAYVPPPADEGTENIGQTDTTIPSNSSYPENNEAPVLNFSAYPSNGQVSAPYANENADNEFNDFEEDDMTRRIREEEEKTQELLRQKSQKEYDEKNQRKVEGASQLQDFLDKREEEKGERAKENVRKEEELREQHRKLTDEAGWKKVISNINIKQGEHKGSKDIGRMRQSILHKKEDEART